MTFSVVIPVKDEVDFLSTCLSSCRKLAPGEIVVATDKPADPRVRLVVKGATNTRILEVEENRRYLFHQAWVKRKAFREAKYDKILVVDVDQSLTKKCLKAIEIVGKNDIAICSLSKMFYARGFVRLIRSVLVFLWVKSYPRPSTTGLYALYRPYWLGAESEDSLQRVKNPKFVSGREVSYGEDTHMFDLVKRRYRIIALKGIGCFCLSDQIEDIPYIQFETGRHYSDSGWNFITTLRWSLTHMRPFLLKGYVYQQGLFNGSTHYSRTFRLLFKITRFGSKIFLSFLLGKLRRKAFLLEVDSLLQSLQDFMLRSMGVTTLGYEPRVSRKLIQFRGERFVDIGANTGYYCKLLSRNFKEVVACEPHPGNLILLQNELKKVPNTIVLPLAISDTCREIDLYQSDICGCHTIEKEFRYRPGMLPNRAEVRVGTNPIKVNSATFDSLNFKNVDLVKIDVEGAEWSVLSGAKESLSSHRIRRLVIELHDRTRRVELERLLTRYGYWFSWLSPDHILGEVT